MSATAFQRQRRELEKAKEVEIKGEIEIEKEEVEETPEEANEESSNEDEEVTAYSAIPFQELKRLCKEKGIEYDIHAKKDDLINLLKGAE